MTPQEHEYDFPAYDLTDALPRPSAGPLFTPTSEPARNAGTRWKRRKSNGRTAAAARILASPS